MSTAADMARFMIAHLQEGRYGDARILGEKTAELMHRQQATMHPKVPGWSYGFQMADTNGRRILEHGGDIGGFSSLMVLTSAETGTRFQTRPASSGPEPALSRAGHRPALPSPFWEARSRGCGREAVGADSI